MNATMSCSYCDERVQSWGRYFLRSIDLWDFMKWLSDTLIFCSISTFGFRFTEKIASWITMTLFLRSLYNILGSSSFWCPRVKNQWEVFVSIQRLRYVIPLASARARASKANLAQALGIFPPPLLPSLRRQITFPHRKAAATLVMAKWQSFQGC